MSINCPLGAWLSRWKIAGLSVVVSAIALIAIQPAVAYWNRPHGDSLLYGKIADTRH